MGLLKRISRSMAAQAAAGLLTAAYIKFVHLTSRWTYVNGEAFGHFIDAKKPVILGCWHGRILMLACIRPRPQIAFVMISRHRDGEVISRAMGHFNFIGVRGSTNQAGGQTDKGGLAALRAMLRELGRGQVGFITPDGPRGPRMRASPGVVTAAQLSGAPILPVSFSTRRRRVLDSWDRFVFARPFTRGVMVIGEPIYVPREAKGQALEAARQAIEDAITAAGEEADRLTGHDPAEIQAAVEGVRAEMTAPT